jgi:hypothetical protein
MVSELDALGHLKIGSRPALGMIVASEVVFESHIAEVPRLCNVYMCFGTLILRAIFRE